MPGRTLDALVQEKLGIAEMVILRLQWQIEDLKASLAERDQTIADARAKESDGSQQSPA